MEKINHRQIMAMNIKKIRLALFLILAACAGLASPRQSIGQIRSGVGYLKMLHGAREVGVHGSLTGALDYTYSFYANPGATGFLREWQWSATYTNWISDIYNASFLAGGNIHTPWSRNTKLLLGVNYLGIPEFGNSNNQATMVSGNHLLATASLGQPLTFLSSNLSVGGNIKYFRSTLAGFDADAFAYDLGLLFRTPRFHLNTGLLDYLIISLGASATNFGNAVTFINEATPLPQTSRAGIAANLGSHHGFQFGADLDYRKIRDEDGYLTFGSEISWRQLVSLRMGYSWEDNLLGHFVFGGSLRFDDFILNNNIIGRNNALRLELASNQNNDLLDSPYHGTITHQPIGPEAFRLFEPAYNKYVASESVILKWELTTDPDLYDDVDHWIVVDKDSSKLARIVELSKQNNPDVFTLMRNLPLFVNQATNQSQLSLQNLTVGDYFWAVLAYDKDFHYRFAKLGNHRIAKFHVTAPDPRVIAIHFDYSEWITTDDYQGTLQFTVSNLGDQIAKNLTVSIFDSVTNQTSETKNTRIYQQPLPELAPGDTVSIQTEWRTPFNGLHDIVAKIHDLKNQDQIESQNSRAFYTIPKGKFSTTDTTVIQQHYQIIYDLPYVGKIFFDSNSAEVREEYFRFWTIEPPLALFAKRLRENPSIRIYLKGTIDPNSDEQDITLANSRANAVMETLHELGVNLDQMEILEGEKLPLRKVPQNPEDRRWVYEERRRVDITTDKVSEELLFKPLQTIYVEKTDSSVVFDSNIIGVVPLKAGKIYLSADNLADSLALSKFSNGSSLTTPVNWLLPQKEANGLSSWLEKKGIYSLTLTDSLNRKFKVKQQAANLASQVIGRERRYFVLANFALASAYYEFYWTNLLNTIPYLLENPDTRISFHGHGCAVGPEAINMALSKQRSQYFHDKFLADVRQRYPELYDRVKQRVDLPKGAGETEPLEFRNELGKQVILGDNEKPLGRQLNRRVMIFFYTSPKTKKAGG
ncbi:MAG TPA: hypothetical protein VGD14_02950 [bacterium]